ncbi:MAG: YggS family pyridoxal phosphate-dependent enzyme [Ruminococcaceae bacterium]|nr:YggS family pyridoxal phosphate-dependent enzyme [Oscillospiraceae bacterium]
MSIMEIKERVAAIREEIAALSGGREVKLLAATKTRTAEEIQAAFAAGIDAAGENKAQEFRDKLLSGAFGDGEVHFFGHLQSNKLKYVVGRAALIHSVDSVPLLRAIDTMAGERGVCQNVLAEVNIGREPGKHGLNPEELTGFLDAAADFCHIKVMGLMTVAPIAEIPDENREYFAKMYQLFIDNQAEKRDNVVMKYLSMGMSGDYRAAISEGSNMVRIGTGIFGLRQY